MIIVLTGITAAGVTILILYCFTLLNTEGTVVTMWSPTERGKLVCKRILAVPGDWIRERDQNKLVKLPPGRGSWGERKEGHGATAVPSPLQATL